MNPSTSAEPASSLPAGSASAKSVIDIDTVLLALKHDLESYPKTWASARTPDSEEHERLQRIHGLFDSAASALPFWVGLVDVVPEEQFAKLNYYCSVYSYMRITGNLGHALAEQVGREGCANPECPHCKEVLGQGNGKGNGNATGNANANANVNGDVNANGAGTRSGKRKARAK